jgi:hypothetical protein
MLGSDAETKVASSGPGRNVKKRGKETRIVAALVTFRTRNANCYSRFMKHNVLHLVVVHQYVPVRTVSMFCMDIISIILFRFELLYDLSHTSTMSHHEFVKELDINYCIVATELSTVAGLGGLFSAVFDQLSSSRFLHTYWQFVNF